MNTSSPLRVAMLSTIAWRTPPKEYGPWEKIVSSITEGLVKKGVDVTLFATQDAVTTAKLEAVAPRGYREDVTMNEKVWDLLHISNVFEQAEKFDIIHNNFDFPPLAYTKLVQTPIVTTIHGFSSPTIIPVYEKYNENTHYVSISDSNRHPTLDYAATVYHGIDISPYTFQNTHGDYLLFFGRIHPDKGTKEAIEVSRRTEKKLIIAGLIQDQEYFDREVKPHIDNTHVQYVGNVDMKEGSKLLGKASALLHMINFDEPFGLSVVEAMACGTPVIAINRGSMAELIVDEK
ncbi:MAG: glycosyltransferase family 4 protein, partial [bacterium]|nr:glycosyltransferase family 4 protein [bacterium]